MIKSKGLFWSYEKSLSYAQEVDPLLAEMVLQYGSIEELKALFRLYDVSWLEQVWQRTLARDSRLDSLNQFLSKFFFGMRWNGNREYARFT